MRIRRRRCTNPRNSSGCGWSRRRLWASSPRSPISSTNSTKTFSTSLPISASRDFFISPRIEEIEDDKGTVDYLEECARDAGLETRFIAMKDIGIDLQGRFTDLEDEVISTMFKLYPWEWIMDEDFARNTCRRAGFISSSRRGKRSSPTRACSLSCGKCSRATRACCHPISRATRGRRTFRHDFVRKPLLSRQGWNVEIHGDDDVAFRRGGPYGDEGYIVQAFHPLPEFDGAYPVIGCWIVAGRSAGLCIREDRNLVTTPDARFVPHVILD